MDEFVFTSCRSSAKLTKYQGSAGVLSVPPYFEGKPVTEIGAGVFSSNYGITAVCLPPTIERIEVNAFGRARNLRYVGPDNPQGVILEESILLQESVRCIESYAFNYNNGIKKLTLLGREVEIEDYAFASCNLEEVYLPNCTNLKLGTGAFIHCANLKTFSAPRANVGMIPACCFEGCLRFQTVDFFFSSVGHDAFHGCCELQKIRLPKTLIYKEPDAFAGCTHLAGRRSYIKRKEKMTIPLSFMQFEKSRGN